MKKFLFLKKAEFSHSKNDLVLFNFIFNLKRLSKGISKIFLVLTLLLAILFCKNNSYAQTEPVFSKKSSWSVIRPHFTGDFIYGLDNYKVDGDTIIEDKNYSKVLRNNNYFCALRETEDHKIYCYFSNLACFTDRELLIYDFDWQPNKTLYHQCDFLDCFHYGEWPDACVQTIVGNTIDSIQLLDGKYYQYLGYNGHPSYIRGIGFINGFFYETFGCCGSEVPRLLCFYIDDELVYLNPDYDDCSANTLNISGIITNNGVAFAGVEILYSINSNLSEFQCGQFTDENGYYSISVSKNSNITIIPHKYGYEFDPQKIELLDITQDTANNNFTTILPEPIKYTVSGTVKIDETTPLEDVTISYTGGYKQTDQYGYYEFEVEENSEIIITPTFSGFSFYPTSDTIIVTNNTTVNFTAYTIGISQLQNTNSELHVYPNPTSGKFTIRNEELEIRNEELEIYDISGRMVQTQFIASQQLIASQRNAKGNELTIDISHLQNGVYFLKIENQIFKIIKN